MRTTCLLLLCGLIIAFSGCSKEKPPVTEGPLMGQAPVAEPPAPEAQPSGKIQITAYINVASGCQEPTVKLVNELAMKYHDLVDMEMVDFGSPEGEERWREDGLDCMTLLFNDSPVLRFPEQDGKSKTVVFAMPAGFSWTHEDLEQAFSAMKDGKLEILSEEEAKREFAPQSIELETAVRKLDGAAEVQINGAPIFTVQAEAAGSAPSERAERARAAIEQWAQEPIHPSQLALVSADKETSIQAKGIEIIRVTQADAKAAKAKGPKQLANEWLKGIKMTIVGEVQKAKQAQDASSPPPDA